MKGTELKSCTCYGCRQYGPGRYCKVKAHKAVRRSFKIWLKREDYERRTVRAFRDQRWL